MKTRNETNKQTERTTQTTTTRTRVLHVSNLRKTPIAIISVPCNRVTQSPPRAQPLYLIIPLTATRDRVLIIFIFYCYYLYCQNQTGHGFPNPTRYAALPHAGEAAGAGARGNNLAGVFEAGDGEGSVEVLSHLSDYPIRDGPGVNPGNVAGGVAALDDDGGAEGGNGLRNESEGFGGGIAGEHAHQKLVGRRTMEPPLEVGGEDLDDGGGVAGS